MLFALFFGKKWQKYLPKYSRNLRSPLRALLFLYNLHKFVFIYKFSLVAAWLTT